MSKIPVGATIAHGYSFGFGKFFTLLKLLWLPLAIMLVSNYFVLTSMIALMARNAAANGAWLLVLLLYPVIVIMLCAQCVIVAQYALDLNTEPGWVHLPFKKPLWRLIGALVIVLLIMMGAMILVGLVIGILTAVLAVAAKPGSGGLAGLVVAIVMLLIYGVFIYGMTRLTFLLTPIVVAESRIGIVRSWTLSRGNFWRMFIAFLALFVPFLALELVGLRFLPSFPVVQPGSPEQVRAAVQAWEFGLLQRMQDYWYISYPVIGAVTVLFYGMLISAQCFAYRTLVPAETEADVFD